jgi:hypothetical protein
MTISIGYSVFWEHERRQQIPRSTITEIESPEVALICVKGLRLFHNELVFNVKRFVKSYASQPKRAKQIWNRWLAEWQTDYKEFGRRYSFDRQPEMQNSTERKLTAAYKRLGALATRYSVQFDEFDQIQSSDRREMKTLFDNLESEWTTSER